MYTKKTINQSPKKSKTQKVSKKTKDWQPGYKKTITMFKTQPDYFQLNSKYNGLGMTTRLVHCANEPGQEFGGVSATIDLSTTFAQPAPGQPVVFDYSRCGNPTRLALER